MSAWAISVRPWGGRLLALLVLAAALAGCAGRTRPPAHPAAAETALTAKQRLLNEASFEQVWKTIRDKHWDPALGGLDWQGVHDELRPRVAAASTMSQARAVMEEMIARLGQSHFQIYPAHLYESVTGPDSLGPRTGTTGLRVRVVDGSALVVAADEGSPARRVGIAPGWEILRVSGEEVRPVLEDLAARLDGKTYLDFVLAQSVQRRMRGKPGDVLAIDVRDAVGREIQLQLPLTQQRGRRVTFGNLPPQWVWFESHRLAGGVGYIAFNFFMDPGAMMKEFAEAMKEFADAAGVVLDLRGNPGGIGAMAMGMAGWFIGERGLRLGTMSMREGQLNFSVSPRASAYGGPVAVLVDGLSASTAEILAGGLQDLGRARVFGTRTAGAALPSHIDRLPNGDGFQYAVASYVSESGRVLEGNGVEPDSIVIPTRAALLERGDPILQAAMEWIRRAG
jgi:carboxyl-terminal processing protease